ncbi:MAG: thioredoxin family protein [Betaproteobacteria bacterium]|nr:MAG: thioredoxin family protein [Betaproteobacteria bacterium]
MKAARHDAAGIKFLIYMVKHLLIALVLTGLVSLPAAANPVRRDHIDVELIPASTSIEPGSVLTVALRLNPDEHWHTYWKNPGDSGLATQITWELPEGFKAGPIQWPTPTRIDVGPLANYGYDGEVLLLTDIEVPRSLPASVPIRASAFWLVCEEICIPGDADLALTLPAGPPAPHPLWSDRIEQVRAALPSSIDGLDVRAQLAGGQEWILSLPRSAMPHSGKLEFFPDEEGWIEYAAPQQTYTADGKVHLRFAAAAAVSQRQGPLTGLLVADPAFAGGQNAAVISSPVTVSESVPAPPPAAPAPAQSQLTLIVALAFAFVGGAILNLMPCVFPVVGIKVLTFVENSRSSAASLRGHGLLFGLGVLVCFWLIAGILLALRAGGATLGWGFQLQSPLVVSALALLFFVLALNMSGVFELGARAQQLAGSVRAQSGYADAFLSGVIATLVATPCTAPFMGAALGFAITQSATVAMTVFTALALGMAAPYVVLSFSPKLVGRLPKPGPWMETLKQILAFPLYLTAVWLIWVLGRQVGVDAIARLLVGMTFIGAGFWAFGRWQSVATSRVRAAARVAAIVLVIGGAVFAWPQADATNQAKPSSLATNIGEWQPWSPEAVVAANQEGRTVFVDFTAAWCVTCQFNKRVVLNKESVQTRFREKGVITMVADWTNRDPQISAALDSLGRSGVPVYVFYAPDSRAPILLPELLTESLVLNGIDKATQPIRTAATRE